MKTTGIRLGLVFGIFACASVLSGQQPEPAKPEALASLYTAGDRVDVVASVSGDAVVAGRSVRFVAPVRGDVLAAGWNVTLDANTQDDVRVAGGHVVVNGSVAGDLTAAGGDVTLGQSLASLGGRSLPATVFASKACWTTKCGSRAPECKSPAKSAGPR